MGAVGRCGVALLACTASGCSFVWAETVSDSYHPSQTPRCTASRGFALGDGGAAALWGLVTILVLTDDSLQDEDGTEALAIIAGGMAVLNATSAWYGFSSSARCREAFDQHDAWLAEGKPAPGRGPPGTQPAHARPDEPRPVLKVEIGPDGQVCQPARSSNPEINSRHGRARAAAATGDCEAVREHAAAIKALDAGYYSATFRCDKAIQKACGLPSP